MRYFSGNVNDAEKIKLVGNTIRKGREIINVTHGDLVTMSLVNAINIHKHALGNPARLTVERARAIDKLHEITMTESLTVATVIVNAKVVLTEIRFNLTRGNTVIKFFRKRDELLETLVLMSVENRRE